MSCFFGHDQPQWMTRRMSPPASSPPVAKAEKPDEGQLQRCIKGPICIHINNTCNTYNIYNRYKIYSIDNTC